jgi:tRNA-modifying protein YgfZ
MVVNAAPNGLGGVDALVEMKLAALQEGDVRLGSAGGAPLRLQPMPYALDAIDV